MKAARAWAWGLVLAYASLIFYLSSLSQPVPWLTHHVWDKALHATEYAGLGALLALAVAETAALRLGHRSVFTTGKTASVSIVEIATI